MKISLKVKEIDNFLLPQGLSIFSGLLCILRGCYWFEVGSKLSCEDSWVGLRRQFGVAVWPLGLVATLLAGIALGPRPLQHGVLWPHFEFCIHKMSQSSSSSSMFPRFQMFPPPLMTQIGLWRKYLFLFKPSYLTLYKYPGLETGETGETGHGWTYKALIRPY